MNYFVWYILIAVVVVFVSVVAVFPFPGPVAFAIHFSRITLSVAALIIFLRMMPTLFLEVPAPRRDYLIGSINFFLISLVCFSFWNQAGLLFAVDTRVLTSYVAGAFSVFAIIACVLALIAADTDGPWPKIIAIAIASVVAVALVVIAPVIAPLFR